MYVCMYVCMYVRYVYIYIYTYGTPPKKKKVPPSSLNSLILGNQRGVPYGYIFIYTHTYACAQLNVYSVFMFVCMKV